MYFILLSLSVLVGWTAVIFIRNADKKLHLLLAFSGAFLLSVTIVHLIPEIFTEVASKTTISVYILAGILMQSLLESVTKGIEHGHLHHKKTSQKFPLFLFLGLSIHSFSEGLPLSNRENNLLLWSILTHKIPVGIILTTFLLAKKYSKWQCFLWVGLFSLMSPLGVFLSDEINFISQYHREITAFNVGIFLHVSTIILFESTDNHNFSWIKFVATLLGMGVVLFIK